MCTFLPVWRIYCYMIVSYQEENTALEEKQMEVCQTTAPARPAPAPRPAPERRDVDDLIFQGEGWLVSDR